ncbi:MAG: peptidoglycan-binding protein [Clostridia bacterium]|nr:peptidoglycan-binding protein [Clostridia bacterium]
MEEREIGTIESLQTMLRNISGNYEDVPLVVPDGIFGAQTLEAVQAFQQLFGLEPDGVVNFNTWNKIVEISRQVNAENASGMPVLAYNESNEDILPGETIIDLYVIQAMMKALAAVIESFDDIEVTGTHDRPSVDAVKKIQVVVGMDDNGIITVEFYDNLAQLYEVFVSRERVNN